MAPDGVMAAAARRPGRRRATGLLRSAGMRFGALYVLLFAISAVALAIFLWWETAGLVARQTDAAINADVQGLAERWNEGGTGALLATINARLAADPTDASLYLLADRNFQPVVGNLSAWPVDVTMRDSWFEMRIKRDHVRSLARIHRFDLPDGFHLLVGRDTELGAQLRRVLTGALLWAVLAVGLLGMAGALVVRGVIHRALTPVFSTAAAISNGDLARRVPRTGKGDEFDSLAETINDMLDRINRLMDGVRHVSDAIAHDLRTPITRARVRLEDAARHAEGADDLHAAIDRANADLDGVVAIFQALLRITEIESGARRSAFEPFDLVPVLAELVEFYDALAEDRSCRLVASMPPSCILLGDSALLQQAAANLLDNALKFSPPGTQAAPTEIAVVLDVSPELRLTIADHGPGMSDADRRRATDRFFRAETARTTPGFGLGLSLVQAVAQLHNGSFTLADNGPGLRATLRLGAAAQRAARPAHAAAHRPAPPA